MLLLVAACGPRDLVESDVAAVVDGEPVRVVDFEAYLADSAAAGDEELGPPVLSALLDDYLDELLVRRLAVDRGLVDRRATAGEALAALMEAEGAPVPGDRRVETYYREHPERYRRPERVRLRQILVEERSEAETALAELAAGEPFAEVARRRSIEPAAARGGDQGILAREDLPPAIAEIVFALVPREVSGIVAADYGFHIFQVTERHPAEEVPLAAAVPEIRSWLARLDREEARSRLVRKARSRYNTAVYASNLPFDYQGLFDTADTTPR